MAPALALSAEFLEHNLAVIECYSTTHGLALPRTAPGHSNALHLQTGWWLVPSATEILHG